MLKFLTTMSVAELLTTVAAWGGLALGIINYWQQSTIKLSVTPMLSVPDSFSGRNLCSLEGLQSLPEELTPAVQQSSRLAVRITNMRQFPVFIENYGFCQNWHWFCRWFSKWEHLEIKHGAYVAKYSETPQPQFVTLPFALKPLESVTIEIQSLRTRPKEIQELLNQRCFCVFAKVTNGHVKCASARKFLDFVLNLLTNKDSSEKSQQK